MKSTKVPRKLSKELKVSQSTVQRALTQDLGVTAFKWSSVHILTGTNKRRSEESFRALLKRPTDDDIKRTIFLDEKIFTIEENVYTQNQQVMEGPEQMYLLQP